jgi:hypothetical protein
MISVAQSLIRSVEARGGRITVEGEWLVIDPREAGEPIVDELRRHKAEIIELLRPAPNMDALWNWLLENCVLCDQCISGLGPLYLDFARWCASRSIPHPGSRDQFQETLRLAGFEAKETTGEVMVPRLILKSNYEVYFGRAPAPGNLETDGTLMIEVERPANQRKRSKQGGS